MKLIALTRGKFAKVDDDVYEALSIFNWHAHFDGRNWYAKRNVKVGKFRTTMQMHRAIMGLKEGDGKTVDHKDNDGLNNQKSNLRVCNKMQNGINRRPHKNGSSKYKGVSISNEKNRQRKKYSYYKASIRVDKILKNLGRFPKTAQGEILAARAYDEAAKKYFGEYAKLNF